MIETSPHIEQTSQISLQPLNIGQQPKPNLVKSVCYATTYSWIVLHKNTIYRANVLYLVITLMDLKSLVYYKSAIYNHK